VYRPLSLLFIPNMHQALEVTRITDARTRAIRLFRNQPTRTETICTMRVSAARYAAAVVMRARLAG
jgi:hypothetical protein